jgi:hypothetical protein
MAQADYQHTTKPAAAVDPARLRARIAVAVEKLIFALDALDAATEDTEEDDPGEENGDDEPSLGWDSFGKNQDRPAYLFYGGSDDREGPDDDREPSLGAIERHCSVYGADRNPTGNQAQWGFSDLSDREDEHDGREPSEDEEPSLGSFDRMTNQEKSWRVRDEASWVATDTEHDDAEGPEGDDEREDDSAEAGIGDAEGLAEQSPTSWNYAM